MLTINGDDILTSGNLNLIVDDSEGATATILTKGMSPGDILGPASISLTNSSDTNGSSLNISFSYVNRDATQTTNANHDTNLDTAAAASELVINALSYDQINLLDRIDDFNSNGKIDIQDAAAAELSNLIGVEAQKSKFFVLQLGTSSQVKDFGIDDMVIRVNFVLNQ